MANYPKINYIGNKSKLVDWIISNMPIKTGTIVDLFSGGSSVSYELKKHNFSVISNDCLYSNYILSKAIIENSKDTINKDIFDIKISDNEITSKYNEISKYLTNILYYDYEVLELAKLIKISEKLKDYQKSLFLALIRRAMIRKLPYSRMNIPWNQIQKLRDEKYSYEKYGRKRAYHNKSFESLMIADLENYNQSIFDNSKNNKSYHMDSYNFIKTLKNKVDIIYMDPPYPKTMNKYGEFYGIYDKIFDKEIDYINLSQNDKFLNNFVRLIKECVPKTDYIVISLNNKTSPSIQEIEQAIQVFGKTKIFEKAHQYKVTNKINKNTTIEQLLILKTKK